MTLKRLSVFLSCFMFSGCWFSCHSSGWFSWWAELIYFIIFIGLLRLWVRYWSLRILNENAWLEQKVAERTEALSESLENLRQTRGQLIQAEKMAFLATAG
jgi:hypothetical protein